VPDAQQVQREGQRQQYQGVDAQEDHRSFSESHLASLTSTYILQN
jgi:hypothetical protein